MDANSSIKIEGCLLGPEVSCAGRKWSWDDIEDNDGGFLQCPISYFMM